MKFKTFSAYFISLMLFSDMAHAAVQHIDNLKIIKIRTVGDFHLDGIFDNVVELWFAPHLALDEELSCTVTYRVFVDAKHTHVVSAAYMAAASGKLVSIHLDDSLPVRGGACEISYLDVHIES